MAVVLGHLAMPGVGFRASTVLIVQPPKLPQISNRLTDVRPSIAATDAVVAAELKTAPEEAKLRDSGLRGSYDLIPRNSGSNELPKYRIPTLQILVTATRQEDALRSLELLSKAFTAALNGLQVDWKVSPDRYVTVAVLSTPSVQRLTGSPTRLLAAAVALGTGWVIAVALWADRRGFRLRLRRHGRSRPRGRDDARVDFGNPSVGNP